MARDILKRSAQSLAKASGGNPVISTITVMLFSLMVNVLEAKMEVLLFGDRFDHWGDPLLTVLGIAYSAYAVYWCAELNSKKDTTIQSEEKADG